jgi:hypothetical protein
MLHLNMNEIDPAPVYLLASFYSSLVDPPRRFCIPLSHRRGSTHIPFRDKAFEKNTKDGFDLNFLSLISCTFLSRRGCFD